MTDACVARLSAERAETVDRLLDQIEEQQRRGRYAENFAEVRRLG